MNNKEQVIYVAKRIKDLREKLVFVGGSIVSLLLDKNYSLEPRMSHDVDIIVEVCGRGAFSDIEKSLRHLGFAHDLQDNLICRWKLDGISVDLMPTDPMILGFTNIWYKDAVKNAAIYAFADNLNIFLISAPYFLATKLDAFDRRGEQDFLVSHDMEDIITLLDGRESLLDEIYTSDAKLQNYLKNKFFELKNNLEFTSALPGHMSPYLSAERAVRIEKVMAIVKRLASINVVE